MHKKIDQLTKSKGEQLIEKNEFAETFDAPLELRKLFHESVQFREIILKN